MTSRKHILLTGGAGYIGSHTYVALVDAGYDVTIFDNFSNARASVIDQLATITQRPVPVIEGDVRSESDLDRVFAADLFDAVIHFAALKAVGESVEMPVDYVAVNVGGLTNVMAAMKRHDVWTLVFSSSATVYGIPERLPITEDAPRGYTNPYGFTKLVSEQLLEQAAASPDPWVLGTLRYFNPAGAHESGMIGENPNSIPNNLIPYIAKVANGELPELSVFGDDYDTPDGTGVRDYIHVSDLAEGHVASVARLLANGTSHTVNLGTGHGYSVLEMIRAYAEASGREIPFRIAPRRAGDVASCYADPALSAQLLSFTARRSLYDMCATSWNWVSSPQFHAAQVLGLPRAR